MSYVPLPYTAKYLHSDDVQKGACERVCTEVKGLPSIRAAKSISHGFMALTQYKL